MGQPTDPTGHPDPADDGPSDAPRPDDGALPEGGPDTAAAAPQPRRSRRRVAAVAAGLVLVGAVAVLANRRGGEVSVDAVDPPPAESTTTAAPSSTVASSASVPTSSAGPVATTTTVPRRRGVVTLTESGLLLRAGAGDQDFVRFGENSESVVARLVAALGPASRDTAWRKDDGCEGSETRRVVWGDLEVVFVRGAVGTEAAARTFQQWFVGAPGTRPAGLITLEGLGVGSTVADLRRVFPGLKLTKPSADGQVGLFVSKPEGEFLEGFTRDTTDAAPITSLWAGLACQRIA